jgi:hypothetical protein
MPAAPVIPEAAAAEPAPQEAFVGWSDGGARSGRGRDDPETAAAPVAAPAAVKERGACPAGMSAARCNEWKAWNHDPED